jgi:hypothetical protein
MALERHAIAQPMAAITRFVIVAAAILPVGGCGGCDVPVTTKAPKWEAVKQYVERVVYFDLAGPRLVASAVGSATPLDGCSPLSALATEAAWRTLLETEANRPYDTAAGAGLVGTFAAPNWGGVCITGTFGTRGEKRQGFGGRWQLPSLFGTNEPIPGIDIEGEERTFVVKVRFR